MSKWDAWIGAASYIRVRSTYTPKPEHFCSASGICLLILCFRYYELQRSVIFQGKNAIACACPKRLGCDIWMMMSPNGNIFRVIGPLCGEFTGDRWIPSTKASDAELLCFLWTNGWVNNREACYLRRNRAHYDVTIIRTQRCPLWWTFDTGNWTLKIILKFMASHYQNQDWTCSLRSNDVTRGQRTTTTSIRLRIAIIGILHVQWDIKMKPKWQ